MRGAGLFVSKPNGDAGAAAWKFPQPQRSETRGGPGPPLLSLEQLPDHSDFPSLKSCAPWHALSARPGPGACLPGSGPRRGPISAGARGPRHASPLLPRGAQLDSGQRAGVGGGERRSVCFLSSGSVPATLGSSKSLTQREEPRLAPVWLPQTALLLVRLPWHLSKPSFCTPEGFGKPIRLVNLHMLHTGTLRLRRGGGSPQITPPETGQGARCSTTSSEERH